MRVLHIHSGNMYGGVETLLASLARCRNLCPEMEPSFALCFEGRIAAELRQAGPPVSLLGEVKTSRFWTVVQARETLRSLIASSAIDVALTHSFWPHAIFGPVLRSAKIPFANWVHMVPSGKHWVQTWARRTKPDLLISNSRFTAASVRDLFGDTPNEIVYLPVEPKTYDADEKWPLRAEFGIGPEEIAILQVSRMERGKGHETLLDALAGLRDDPRWICLIAGGPQQRLEFEYLSELKAKAAGLGIQHRVRFLGQCSNVAQLMRASDIFCHPNHHPEGFGIVFIEAMMAGLPVVCTNIGAATEIVDSSCGVLVPPTDSAALAAALETLVNSADERRRLGSMAPQRARRISDPSLQLKRIYAVLNPLTSQRATTIPFTHAPLSPSS